MVFIDSNIPMYIVGAPHPNKDRAIEVATELVRNNERLVTSAEVYQEILHRYVAIRRFEVIGPAFEALDALVDDILTFGVEEIREAYGIVSSISGISARDALHTAVMRQAGINRILSFDAGFDAVPELERLH